jgi:hypothetical protein
MQLGDDLAVGVSSVWDGGEYLSDWAMTDAGTHYSPYLTGDASMEQFSPPAESALLRDVSSQWLTSCPDVNGILT